jgi:hypothetical protein
MDVANSTQTLLAATDLVSGSRSLYTIGVGVLVVFILLAGGARAASPSSSDPATPSTYPANAPSTAPASPPANSASNHRSGSTSAVPFPPG